MPDKNSCSASLAVAGVASAAAPFRYDAARMLEIHGHRGARGLLPENTLPAFERAIALGVGAVEFDVCMTRDGVPVVHHDTALNPDHTRDASGRWLEPPGPEALALAVAEVLRAEGTVGRATVQSFDWRVLRALQTLAPDIAIACLTSERGWRDTVLRGRAEPSPWTAGLGVDAEGGSVPRLVRRFGAPVWMPFHADLTAEALTEARTLGLRVMVWTVNEIADMEALARLGVDGIVTDYPDRTVGSLLASAPR